MTTLRTLQYDAIVVGGGGACGVAAHASRH